MELRHLRYFVAVAEERSFSRAAKRLNISQPPLSTQIAGLEQLLGFKLLDRNKRNVALTKAGETLLGRARALIANADEAAEEARRVARGYEGKLAIGFMSAVMLVRLADFLQQFHALSPNAEVGLRQMPSNDQYVAVVNGELDVGFVDIAVTSMHRLVNTTDLCSDLALHERLMLCVSNQHPLAARKSVSFNDLADTDFLTLARHAFPSFFDLFIELCKKAGFHPHIVQQVESMPVAVAMAASGYGAAIVPELSMSGVHPSNARFIPLEEEAYVDIHMIYRTSNQTTLVERLSQIVRHNI